MLKHCYRARLSLWHVVLVVILLAVSLPLLAGPASPPTPGSAVPSPPAEAGCQEAPRKGAGRMVVQRSRKAASSAAGMGGAMK